MPPSPSSEFSDDRFITAGTAGGWHLFVCNFPIGLVYSRLRSMPIYEYELCDGNCAACGGKFTLRRPLDAKELTHCPSCKKPVRKLFSTFNSPKSLSISDAKKAGFTVLKKTGKGEYERQ